MLLAKTTLILIVAASCSMVMAQNVSSQGACQLGIAFQDIDINGVRARLLNTGGLYRNGAGPIYNVPVGSSGNSMFAASIWLGGLVNGELRMAASDYGPWEMWPGPLDHNGNAPADCNAFDRLYKVSLRELTRFDETGESTFDMLDWPWELGAPVRDGDGNPNNYNLAGGDRPAVEGHQTVWWVMNDKGNEHAWSRAQPMGIEVQVTAFAASSPEPEINFTTYYRYKLENRSGEDIEDAYFGIWSDLDIGDGNDDYVGSDTTVGLAYGWNGDDFDEGDTGYGDRPPAIGYSVVKGILVDDDGLDNNGNGQIDEADERLGMTKFVYYPSDRTVQGNPRGGEDAYRYLRGLWLDSEPITLGGTGRGFSEEPVDFMFAGSPPNFWSEEDTDWAGSRNTPGDRRFVWSVGPFRFPSGASKEIVVALTWASGDNRFESVKNLIASVPVVRAAYDDGFELDSFAAPSAQPVLLAPENNATEQPSNVTLYWSNVAIADGFEVEVFSEGELYFTDMIHTSAEPAATGLGTIDLTVDIPNDSEFSWRVRAINAIGYGPWSETARFSTGTPDLNGSGPLLTSPTDGSPGEAAFATFEWLEVENASLYHLQVDSDIEFTSPVIDDSTLTSTSYTHSSPLTYNTTYYWRVRLQDRRNSGFENFLTVQNAAGPIDPPTGAAADFRDFPVPRNPGDEQQVGEGHWLIHTGGSFATYTQFVDRTTRDNGNRFGGNWPDILQNDYEMRFTNDDDNFGFHSFSNCSGLVSVPFELWDIGVATPDDPTDDHRMFPFILDYDGDCEYGLNDTDHLGSSGENDPYTDWTYWYDVADQSPGEAGYQAQLAAFQAGGDDMTTNEELARMVLVNWNGGDVTTGGPYNQDMPEEGSIFRIVTKKTSRFSIWSTVWSFTTAVGTATDEDRSAIPTSFALHANYPNPFNPTTTISFDLPESTTVRLVVFDALGRVVESLVSGRWSAGRHRVTWKADQVPSGVYFVRIEAGSFVDAEQILLLR